jgi:TonB family protein
MRSKMLGLAIALSTFGLGVAATTAWIIHQTPNVPAPARLLMSNTIYEEKATTAAPQDETTTCRLSSTKSMTIIGGNMNGQGIESPPAIYPPIARAAAASGTVVVQVLVDECGRVSSARAASGHPLLQQAAVQAAYRWRFSQLQLNGEHVKVKGILTFNFVL